MQPNNPFNNQPQYQMPHPQQGVVYPTSAQGSNMNIQPTAANTANMADTVEKPHKWWILITGSVLALILCTIGVIVQINRQATGEFGRSVDELNAEIKILDAQIAAMSEDEGDVFEREGFSAGYYASANERTEIELQKAELVELRNDAVEQGRASSPFRTGTIWFFIGAIIALIIAITAFIRL